MDNANVINEIVKNRRGETARPLTNPEKAFWKDAFVACAQSTLRQNGKHLADDAAATICANFADAAMDAYRARTITWR